MEIKGCGNTLQIAEAYLELHNVNGYSICIYA